MDNLDGEANDVKNEPPLHHDIQMQRKQRRNTEDYLKVIKVFGGDRPCCISEILPANISN